MPAKTKKRKKKRRRAGVPRINVVQNTVMSAGGKPLEVVVKNSAKTWGELGVSEREGVEQKRNIGGGSGTGVGVFTGEKAKDRRRDQRYAERSDRDAHDAETVQIHRRRAPRPAPPPLSSHGASTGSYPSGMTDWISGMTLESPRSSQQSVRDRSTFHARQADGEVKLHLSPVDTSGLSGAPTFDEMSTVRTGGRRASDSRNRSQESASEHTHSLMKTVSLTDEREKREKREAFLRGGAGLSPTIPLLGESSSPTVPLWSDSPRSLAELRVQTSRGREPWDTPLRSTP